METVIHEAFKSSIVRSALTLTTDACEQLVRMDPLTNTTCDLMKGKPLDRPSKHDVTLTSWLLEKAVALYDLQDPRIEIYITDWRLASIIIKNTKGTNSVRFMNLDSKAMSSITNAESTPVNRHVSLVRKENNALFPSVYQYALGSGQFGAFLRNVPGIAHLCQAHIPRIYSEPTLATLIGGAFEIRGYAQAVYSQNDRPCAMSQVSNHLNNYKGVILTMRKSDVDDVQRLILTWCQREKELRPSVCFTWREGAWKQLMPYLRNRLGSKILRNTELYRSLEQASQRMLHSKLQHCMCCFLYGPPGTGKTRTVFELAQDIGYTLYCTPFEPDEQDTRKTKDHVSLGVQLDRLANLTEPFMLLIDDLSIKDGEFVSCSLSRSKLLSLFEGQGFPSKSIIVLVSNHMHREEMAQMYGGAMCRSGRARLIESMPLSNVEKRRISRCLHHTKYRDIEMASIARLCELFEQMLLTESGGTD